MVAGLPCRQVSTVLSHDRDSACRVLQVTFSNLKVRTVTKEGDVFDPSGSLTGGSAPNEGASLIALFQVGINYELLLVSVVLSLFWQNE